MNDLTLAEQAALDAWNSVSADTTGMLFAVRAAVRVVERRSEDARLPFLREELAAVRDLAYRGSNETGARDAVDAIFERASKALNAEAAR